MDDYINRPIKHSIYHKALEAHSSWKPRKPYQLELLIKTAALFSRTLVISDSDLNNHSLLSQISNLGHDTVFHQAITTGFIRRAARMQKDGSPRTQVEVFKDFSKNNPRLARKIPSGHPRILDSLFDTAEKTTPALLWELNRVAGIFADRFLFELDNSKLAGQNKEKVDKIKNHIYQLEKSDSVLRAATIEHKFLKNRRNDQVEKEIWDLMRRAYNGNVIASFEGELAVLEPPFGDPYRIPGGPGASIEEKRVASDFYRSLYMGDTEQTFEIGIEQISLKGSDAPDYYLDLKALMSLSIPEIEELRESAFPDSYFNKRHSSLAGPKFYSSNRENLHSERLVFWENLARAGLALAKESAEGQYRNFETVFLKRMEKRKRKEIENESKNLVINLVAELTQYGKLQLLIDWVSLHIRSAKLDQINDNRGSVYKELKEDAIWIYTNGLQKRPDYQVIKEIRQDQS